MSDDEQESSFEDSFGKGRGQGRKRDDNMDRDFDIEGSYDSTGVMGQANTQAHTDRPYDEAVEIEGSDSNVSTPDSSPGRQMQEVNLKQPHQQQQPQYQQPKSGIPGGDTPLPDGSADSDFSEGMPGSRRPLVADTSQGRPDNAFGGSPKHGDDSGSETETSSEDDEDSDKKHPGQYNAQDYQNLPVSNEVKELFQYIDRYKPHIIELDTKLKPFIPDFIPCVGEVDAFLKIPRPDNKKDNLGLVQLDEPALNQSDPTVVDLQLRSVSKHSQMTPMDVRSIEVAEKNPREITNWINRISDLHKSKPLPNVQYAKKMPDIEQLMQVWPAEFEDFLSHNTLPLSQLDLELPAFVRVLAAIMDIPVHSNLTDPLHVMFTLYSEFKNNQHFSQSFRDTAGAPLGMIPSVPAVSPSNSEA